MDSELRVDRIVAKEIEIVNDAEQPGISLRYAGGGAGILISEPGGPPWMSIAGGPENAAITFYTLDGNAKQIVLDRKTGHAYCLAGTQF
ncbi:MAG: hypothetical protein ACO1SX_21015 [Actinomycetota bacterium]